MSTVNGGTALIAGATGAAASRLVAHLDALGWSVSGLCRTPRSPHGRTTYVPVDLLDGDAVAASVRRLPPITHVFYASRAKHGEGGSENVTDNVAMLRHVLDAVSAHESSLAHVHLVEGGKWYGQHLGPFPTPAREDDPRHMPPNFYYDQEDLLRARQSGRRWTWSASRANVIFDFAPERARNIVSIVGAYAAICRELGLALDYPGHPTQFRCLTEITDATHLARALHFIATSPVCANGAFNVTNGDVFRWERLWPRIAQHFGLAMGVVRPMLLADVMRDKEDVWQAIVRRHGLVPKRLDQLALWSFADALFRQTYDVVSSTTKLRKAGFADVVDSEDQLLAHLASYREARILP